MYEIEETHFKYYYYVNSILIKHASPKEKGSKEGVELCIGTQNRH